jgi:hypothetical protein
LEGCVVSERDVRDELKWDPDLDADDIAVSVKNSVVTLAGFTKSYTDRRPDLKAMVTIPDVLMQAYSAPLQIVFYDGKDFPADYNGSGFVTMHGSWNRAQRTDRLQGRASVV